MNKPEIIKQPSLKEIREAYKLINSEDAPILAAAIKAKPDFLITWDIKDFLKKEVVSNVSLLQRNFSRNIGKDNSFGFT